jgi:predicted amidohydrolase
LPLETGVESGTEFLVFDVPDRGRFGISICYDMWFPETTRTLTSLGVEVLLHPVLTGTTDRQVELAIAQATAAMFQCYVFDVNGLEAGGIGRSIVVDPAGVVLHQAGQRDEIFPITVDFGLVRHVRHNGANGLGQMLKSFRDRSVKFPDQNPGNPGKYLEDLGPMITIQR